MTFLRKIGRMAETMQRIEKTDMGAGSGASATIGDRTVENRAKMLQIPKAVPTSAVGNI